MTRTESIETEINALLHAYDVDSMRPAETLANFHDLRRELWVENAARAQELMQPWLSIFEFGLVWLAHVRIALANKIDIDPQAPDLKVPWVLVGSASAFGWSLLQACLTGFDTPTKAQLRTYVEILLLCLAILYDNELAKAYQSADTNEMVVNFWHTHASPRNLHRRIIDIERTLGLDSETITALTTWRREEYEVLSQSAHLSYVLAALTCFPISIENEETCQPGILCVASANSHRTLDYAARTTWYFSRP